MTDRNRIVSTELPDHRAWLNAVARQMLGGAGHPLHDDLVQEGYIAMWRAVDTHDPSRGAPLAGWMQYRARHRMLDIRNQRAKMTGTPDGEGVVRGDRNGQEARTRIREYLRANPAATGRQIAQAVGLSEATVSYHRKRLMIDVGKPEPETSLEHLLDLGLDIAAVGDVVDEVIAAYHHGVIAEALDLLTPTERKYVVLRFWHGMGTKELTGEFGYNPGALWRTARRRLEPALRELVTA